MPEASYLDTSFLLKIYVQEPGSPEAILYVRQHTGPLVISPLNDVEMVSSLFRKLPADIATKVHAVYRRNRLSGAFAEVELNRAVFDLAEQLAQTHSGSIRLRSLDLLHLATTLHYSIPTLATYDHALAAGAITCGLSVVGPRP